jgi:hypothetical protein
LFNKVAQSAPNQVHALKVTRLSQASGSLQVTTADGHSHTAMFRELGDLVGNQSTVIYFYY